MLETPFIKGHTFFLLSKNHVDCDDDNQPENSSHIHPSSAFLSPEPMGKLTRSASIVSLVAIENDNGDKKAIQYIYGTYGKRKKVRLILNILKINGESNRT